MDKNRNKALINIAVSILLVAVLMAGMYLRTMNTNWDEGRHLHPDERFLSQVISVISPVDSVEAYFDTARSSLNPANRDFGFFVYGTLPVFIIRYVGEWTGQTGYDLNTLVGRQLSAGFDVLTILLVFLIGLILYNKWVGLGGATLYAFAVLPIQQAHFMTVDSFTNTFGMLTVLAAVLLLKRKRRNFAKVVADNDEAPENRANIKSSGQVKEILLFLFFGIALGMATASKINAVSLALLLPLVELVRYLQTPVEERAKSQWRSIVMIVLAGVISFLVFRTFQPYAFDGPVFFGMKINQGWWGSMQSLRGQATGEVDFPPALQWTRRELTFSVKNLVLWGVGIPFAVTAFLGALTMLYKIIKRKEMIHLPVLAWTAVYFAWQGFAWVKAMRYLLLIYPLLAIFAGWLIYTLIAKPEAIKFKKWAISKRVLRITGIFIAVITIVGTAAYAWAFTRIYTRPVTRVAATDWIIETIPGPINFKMNTEQGEINYPVGYRYQAQLDPGKSVHIPVQLDDDSQVLSLSLSSLEIYTDTEKDLAFNLRIKTTGEEKVISDWIPGQLNYISVENTKADLTFYFDEQIQLQANETYLFEISANHEVGAIYISSGTRLGLLDSTGKLKSMPLPNLNQRIMPESPYRNSVYIAQAGVIHGLDFPFVLDAAQRDELKSLVVTLYSDTGAFESQSVTLQDTFKAYGDGRGKAYSATFETPIFIEHPQVLTIEIKLESGEGEITFAAYAPVHESSWDDGLPTSKPGFIGYATHGGLYQGGLNLELYWPDDTSKLERIKESLIIGDYIFITSNRQWGTIPRVPERYPLSTFYYQSLMGCPEDIDVVTCYNLAEPGMYQGVLGFELVKTFTSYPTLGKYEFNDQFAEEAFSVYDHPKVLILKKRETFKPEMLDILNQVDLDKAVFLTPRQAHTYKASQDGAKSLMLDENALNLQREGGTWAELFNRDSWINRYPVLTVIVFYFFVTLLGWLAFPLIQPAFAGLKDKGYAFSKLIGLLLFSWIAFSLGSAGVAVTRKLLWIVFAFIALLGIIRAVLCRKDLVGIVSENWKQFLVIEAIGLVAFLFFLWIRWLNPDLWHQWKGGEKPMDFSYLNAVLKSNTFPAYDPWYAGGYINYYYYGQVIVGMPVKALGIVPAVAYNIILPLWFSLLAMGTFSITWNISKMIRNDAPERLFGSSFVAGLAGVFLVCILGNLGELKVIAEAWMSLGAQGIALQELSFMQRFGAFFRGIAEMFRGQVLPVPPGNWYWNPSRAIPGEPITEFPFFTFLYADLHAHLISLPIVIASVGWSLSMLNQKISLKGGKFRDYLGLLSTFVIGGLIIGALKPTNTWDIYTFFSLAACVLVYRILRYGVGLRIAKTKEWQTRILASLLTIALLYGLSMLMYAPFNEQFKPGFTEVGFWQGDRTPISSYLMHWGLPLFVILVWFAWETYQWTNKTRLSELPESTKAKKWIIGAGIFLIVLLLGLLILKVGIALIALPVCVWALVLLLSPRQSDGKRFLYFIIGTGFLLTLVVELVHLVGDIGRMNVVFKLYMQAWLLINLATASGLAIVLRKQKRWTKRIQALVQIPLIILLMSATLFPILATRDKATDRMSYVAPHTLDGMEYMQSSFFYLDGIQMDLSQDYRAIKWMQENVKGSPVILEGQTLEYSWGNRFTIYTGLPSVVGWNYHQRQQRALWANNAVWDRVNSVNEFYLTSDQGYVENYLVQHDIRYIVLGQLERIRYYGDGLQKFDALEGVLWDMVYQDGDTIIYKVK